MLLLKGRQVDADIPQIEQNLLSIVAPWANFKAVIACIIPQWCWRTDQVFRRLKGAPSEALSRFAHHQCETVQKGAKSLLECEMSILSNWIAVDNSRVRTHMARHFLLCYSTQLYAWPLDQSDIGTICELTVFEDTPHAKTTVNCKSTPLQANWQSGAN